MPTVLLLLITISAGVFAVAAVSAWDSVMSVRRIAEVEVAP